MVVWIYGQPCSGKTTMAEKVYTHLFFNAIYQTQLLDGDELRKLFKNNSYDRSGRIANISRAIDNRKYAATFTIGNWLEGHLKVYNDDK